MMEMASDQFHEIQQQRFKEVSASSPPYDTQESVVDACEILQGAYAKMHDRSPLVTGRLDGVKQQGDLLMFFMIIIRKQYSMFTHTVSRKGCTGFGHTR